MAENRYDTLGLEAAYLAHGQSDRILQLEEALRLFEQMEISQTREVTMGSLVELENERGENSFVFVGPSSGGLKVTCSNLPIHVITPVAPLGQMLMGAQVGDDTGDRQTAPSCGSCLLVDFRLNHLKFSRL